MNTYEKRGGEGGPLRELLRLKTTMDSLKAA